MANKIKFLLELVPDTIQMKTIDKYLERDMNI